MERRRLGRTGHRSSVAILGGAACWAATPEAAGAWLQLARQRGVNHLDIAPQYGRAEAVVGPHLAACRAEMFVAGKTLRANPDGVRDAVRHHPSIAPRRRAGPLPGSCRHHPGGAGPAVRGTRAHSPAPRTGPDAFCRDHRPRSGRTGGLLGGLAALRPRHGHVPGLSASGDFPATGSRLRSCWPCADNVTSG